MQFKNFHKTFQDDDFNDILITIKAKLTPHESRR